jgi:hypothetical protein
VAPNTDWPHLLADLTAKRDALNQVIELLTTTFIREDAPSSRATVTRPAKALKRNERTNERAKRAPTGTRPRSLPDDGDHTAQIVAAVKKAGGIVTRGELLKALGTSLYHTKQWLAVALKAKAVVATGIKAHYRISLPGARPAKEAP